MVFLLDERNQVRVPITGHDQDLLFRVLGWVWVGKYIEQSTWKASGVRQRVVAAQARAWPRRRDSAVVSSWLWPCRCSASTHPCLTPAVATRLRRHCTR